MCQWDKVTNLRLCLSAFVPSHQHPRVSYSYFYPCHLIASFHFLLPLVPLGFTQEVPRPALPLSLLLISPSHMQSCVQCLTHREELWFLLFNEKWSSLPGSPSLFCCVPSQMIHPSPTCSWSFSCTLQPQHEPTETEWVACVCVFVCFDQLHLCLHVESAGVGTVWWTATECQMPVLQRFYHCDVQISTWSWNGLLNNIYRLFTTPALICVWVNDVIKC